MTEILTRAMTTSTPGGLPVLEAVRDRSRIHVVLASGADARRLGLEAVPGLRDAAVRVVGGCPVAHLTWAGQGPLPCGAGPVSLSEAETGLFAGLDVLMGTRNGESWDNVETWLHWHAERHGVQAALIVDRHRPDEAPLDLDGLDIPGLVRVVLLHAPVPLGQNLPSERHPITAPDAPGKDRMDPRPVDRWTAPLGQIGLYEALRWRFLSRAAAVASLDVHDYLAPDADAFETARGAETGVAPLVGRRVFPWRIRKGADPTLFDHICDRFDEDRGNRRWVCVPGRIPEDQPWRLVRIGGVPSDADDTEPFLRAMALRVTEGGGLPLAPKSSLTADDALVALAREVGHKPVLPPARATARPGALPAAMPGRTAIVTCMKNEGPFILEWLAHHRAIGVDDFLIYTNDCTDGTDTLLDQLQSQGIVQHRQNPFREPGYEDMKPQHAALAAAEAEPVMARAGWGICMDVDEFIDVHVGSGHLSDLYAAVGGANMISMTWRLFGNADLDTFDTTPTSARFLRCAPRMTRKPHQAWGFKTLFRNMDIYKKMGVHRPKGLRPELWEDIAWVNGSGRPMPKEMLRNGWRSTTSTVGYDLVTLNHYAVRDAESFLVKRDRGRVNHVERDQGLGYWFRMNNNAEEDRSILRHLPALEAEMGRLLALPGIRATHDACIAAHRARIAELRAAPAFARFYSEVTGERMKRLSRLHRHFGANVFLAGPDAVPDEVAFGDPAPGFFFTVGEVDETAH
ncbi:glycosyltransferase family 2 protein [Jannaschia aquimarina]|uniref:Glycosyl transferase family 2 n=1 Tax=Jannaschia aquimarina TaxID=935700 RepID=A0A0D1EME4_9RHOB|nr:glycosyltransferase family 2 protein [Jannaschia aquimarina]KIT18156.1 hypothetical protein jaqu_00900 [Jannaschia aquimarina]SNT30609.1 Glycosyl transferase family 2 [Jannaschia aquimarina]